MLPHLKARCCPGLLSGWGLQAESVCDRRRVKTPQYWTRRLPALRIEGHTVSTSICTLNGSRPTAPKENPVACP